MTPALATGIALIVWTIGFVVLGIISWKNARRLRRLRVAEQIRGTFAEARNALVLKALRGGIDPASETYRTLYYLQTQMMRREDQYDKIWSALVAATAAARTEPHAHGIALEQPKWDMETRRIAAITASGIRAILIEYSVFLRVFSPVIRPRRQATRDLQAHQPVESLYRRVEAFEVRRRPERQQVSQFLPLLDRGDTAFAA